jgi:predicted glycoside hydrolase/deacetylase ChbG (UPF0249 family)
MSDSVRAAEIARANELPVGLHLNLDEQLTARDVPDRVRRQHDVVRRSFSRQRLRRWSYAPSGKLRNALAGAITAQIDEFERLYGRPPTHLDSHHHTVELSLDAIYSGAIRPATKVRNPSWPERRTLRRVSRNWRRAVVRRRFVTTAHFRDIRLMHPAFGGVRLETRLAPALAAPMEVMVHPGFSDELPVLLSSAWTELISAYRRGSWAEL